MNEGSRADAADAAFPWVTQTYRIAGRDWHLTTVEDQDALLHRVHTETDLANFPYGLLLWPSAIGLCEHLRQNGEKVRNKRVLEIGAGVGLVGLVAQTLSPACLIQTDYHADALFIAQQNATQNGLADTLFVRQGDWRNWPADLSGFDLVIGSDVLYERSLHDDLARLFPRLLAPGGEILLSDPLRPQAVSFVERLEKSGQWHVAMDGRRVVWENEAKDIALFTLRPKK